MAEAEIAVIIPNFQRKERLRRALASVLEQTLHPAEVVIVDDASTNDLSEIRKEVESASVRWLTQERNAGPGSARNAGAAATISPWITFLDSDDWWESEKLEKQWAWHSDHPEFRISQVKEKWVRGGKAVKKPSHWEPREGDLFADSVERCSIGPSCVCLHRSLWAEVGGFDPRFRVCEDYELWLRITLLEQVGKIPGEFLVSKDGDGLDQLSRITPAMDRHRVVGLLELLKLDTISSAQRKLAIQGIRRKTEILSQGAVRRGQESRSHIYRRMAEADWQTMKQKLFDDLLEQAWAEAGKP